MPDGANISGCQEPGHGLDLRQLKVGCPDAIGARVISIEFRTDDFAIYRSERGIYAHFSDDPAIRQSQVFEYTKLSKQLCELRYLTNQMRPDFILRWLGFRRDLIYDHNMGQALILLLTTEAERRANKNDEAGQSETDAKAIADRALEMAIKRNTVDNTIRYVTVCVVFGLIWLAAAAALLRWAHLGDAMNFVIASGAGILGAMFSVVVRAQTLDLKPCDDSHLNYMMSCVRVGMGGIAGPILLLLILTVAASAIPGAADALKGASDASTAIIQTVCVIGLLAGFAERMVPNLVQAAANQMETRAGTPGQASKEGGSTSTSGEGNKSTSQSGQQQVSAEADKVTQQAAA